MTDVQEFDADNVAALEEDPGYRLALVSADGTVENVILVPADWPWRDDAWPVPDGFDLVDAEENVGASPGGRWAGGRFTPPDPAEVLPPPVVIDAPTQAAIEEAVADEPEGSVGRKLAEAILGRPVGQRPT